MALLKSGTELGRYTILGRLATGGMSEIYLARQSGPSGFTKVLALKVILPHLAEDPTFMLMFLNEAKLAALLNHPNVVQIFDFGQADEQCYIAMEYIDGQTLRGINRTLKRDGKRIPRHIALRIIADTCGALEYAHSMSDSAGQRLEIVHRDVSLENILVTYSGQVKLVDFGVAKARILDSYTSQGTLKGKYSYMAPELVRGEHPDHRLDIFALGVVMYAALLGQLPFKAKNHAQILDQILHEPPAPPRERDPEMPVELEQIVLRAMHKDRGQRYQRAGELQAELEGFIMRSGMATMPFHLAQFMSATFPPGADQNRETYQQLVGASAFTPSVSTPTGTSRPERSPAPVGEPSPAQRSPTQLSPAQLSPAHRSPAHLSPAHLSPAHLSSSDLAPPAPTGQPRHPPADAETLLEPHHSARQAESLDDVATGAHRKVDLTPPRVWPPAEEIPTTGQRFVEVATIEQPWVPERPAEARGPELATRKYTRVDDTAETRLEDKTQPEEETQLEEETHSTPLPQMPDLLLEPAPSMVDAAPQMPDLPLPSASDTAAPTTPMLLSDLPRPAELPSFGLPQVRPSGDSSPGGADAWSSDRKRSTWLLTPRGRQSLLLRLGLIAVGLGIVGVVTALWIVSQDQLEAGQPTRTDLTAQPAARADLPHLPPDAARPDLLPPPDLRPHLDLTPADLARPWPPTPAVRPTVTPVAAPTPKGSVTLAAPTPAEALLDGKLLGSLPLRRHPVRPGKHRLLVRSRQLGYQLARRIVVKPGADLELQLKPRKGTLRILVRPWARVTLDGRLLGVTPLSPIPLYEGTHLLVLDNNVTNTTKRLHVQVHPGRETVLKVRMDEG